MARGLILIFVAALCVAQTPTKTEPGLGEFLGRRIPPVDAATGHTDLVRFRSRLIAAADSHDLNYLLNVTDPTIGGCGWSGVDGLRQYLRDLDGWDSIRSALRLGGVMPSPRVFQSNYVMMTFPPDADMTEYLVVSKADAVVHEKPNTTSAALGHLHYEIVIPVAKAAQWQQVEYRPGKTGYLLSRDLESPNGVSVHLESRQGKWRIVWISSYCD